MRGILLAILLVSLAGWTAAGQWIRSASIPARAPIDRQIAARFAPVFIQALGEHPRGDYITNFDFDGDWKGDNNWSNLDNRSYPLRAYIYYSVSETPTHYFIHYAAFHPRDYKGGLTASTIFSALIRTGIERLGRDPTGGLADDVALSHENDLEGCLVVAAKRGGSLDRAVLEYVETLSHHRYLKYRAPGSASQIGEQIELRDGRPVLFIEPKGHGIERYTGDAYQERAGINGRLTYVYAGRADDPERSERSERSEEIGYDLLPIEGTFWQRAQGSPNETYGEATEYSGFSFSLPLLAQPAKAEKGKAKGPQLGSALRGEVGFPNKARPPWGWFDMTEKDRPLGEWFFDPAATVKRHYRLGSEFATSYVYNPYLKRSEEKQ